MIRYSRSEADNEALAHEVLEYAGARRFFAFAGDLGAGKTTFIKALCRALGVTADVTSPTFALVNDYQGTSSRIYHFDCYRLRDEREAYDIGADEYFDSGEYCFVEWAEMIPSFIPDDAVHIALYALADGSREIHVR